MGILDGKRIFITGLVARSSIAFRAAQLAQQEGATIAVSNFGRGMRMTKRSCLGLKPPPPLIELDATKPEDLERLPEALDKALGGRVDGILHSIAYANPFRAMGGRFMTTPWEDVSESLQISAFSLMSITRACLPLMSEGSSVVGMSFQSNVSWVAYDWMGVSKATLESVSRYLARFLGPMGIRSNIVSSGPLNTLSKKAIPFSHRKDEQWNMGSVMTWNPD
ncbi:MAG: SDR family oxidoreductase, partial [Propionibacteriaceae bacterium]|nr:SDR family oxidoreductase [Propionibacteriaceae bacterium]